MSEIPAAQLMELLATVREAVSIPFPATVGDHERYSAVLEDRVRAVRVSLDAALDDARDDLTWDIDYLRRKLAEHAPTGYQHSGGTP